MTPVSGGYRGFPGTFKVVENDRTSTGWRVTVQNESNRDPLDITVSVYCAK